MNETQRHTNPDRHTTRARAAAPRRRPARPAPRARRALVALLALGLLAQLLAAGGASVRTARAQPKVARAQGEIEIKGAVTRPTATATVNFADLAARDSGPGKDALAAHGSSAVQVEPPPAPPEPESELKAATTPPALKSPARAAKSGAGAVKSDDGAASSGGKLDPLTAAAVGDESRAPALNFPAQSDAGTHAPPDASGAVGLDKVLSTHRSNYVVQDKATGAVLSSVSMESFWAPTGATGIYNPRALYDPYTNRWLVSAVSDARSANSSVLLAVSETPDPEDSFFIFRFDADENDQLWADYASIGFNGNWVALSFNAHNVSNDAFNQGVVLALSYGHLGVGVADAERFAGITAAQGGFSMQPAVTYSKWQEGRQFFVSHLGSGAATYRVSWLEGTPTDPVLVIGVQKSIFNSLGGWTQPGGETLPQAGGARKIDSSDSRAQKAVYRNGSIYYCQTVGLPAGRTAATIDRTAAQWVQVDTNGDFVQGGRVEDPTATATNGGKWYAYPSLAVNHLGDILVGFTEFSATQFASAGYAVRVFDDPAGTTRLPRVYKAGEGHYERALPGARNLWGLYSNAQVDPANDLHLWTIQEHAAQPAGSGPGAGRWATRWAKLIPPSADRIAFVSNRDGNDEIYTMEADGSHVRRMTFDPGQDTSPTWSPDRGQIAFTHYGPDGPEIRIVLADVSDVYFLTFGSEPAWSPDNNYIAFVRGIDIWTHLVGDGEEINVTNNEAEDSYYRPYQGYFFADTSPAWSPDSQTLVFLGQIEDTRRIFTMPYWGGQRTLVKSGDGIQAPAWSPTGAKIAYTDYRRICTMNPNGTGSLCTTTSFHRDYGPAWSPDGSKILFATNRTGDAELFTMNPDFSGAANLSNRPTSNEGDPAW